MSCLYPPVEQLFHFSILRPREIHARPKPLDVVFKTYFQNVIYKVKDIAALEPLKVSLTTTRVDLTICCDMEFESVRMKRGGEEKITGL